MYKINEKYGGTSMRFWKNFMMRVGLGKMFGSFRGKK